MQRYLTVEEKRRRIAEWCELRSKPVPEGDLAGKGYPDAAVFELTDRLNAIEGVCTTQSCAGHTQTERRGPESGRLSEHPWHLAGCLWLRLSWAMFAKLLENVDCLVAHPRIEQVAIMWGRERGGHVVEIVFEGLNRGEQELAESGQTIANFFEGVVLFTVKERQDDRLDELAQLEGSS